MQNALSQLEIYGDIYQLQIKESSLSLLKEEHQELFRMLQKLCKYIGQANRKSAQPFKTRFKEHLKEFEECESGDVNKAVIFCAIKLLFNQMLKEGVEPVDYEDLIESVRLNNHTIKTQLDLNTTEGRLIKDQNPLLNSVKYKNYELPEQKELNRVDRELLKL